MGQVIQTPEQQRYLARLLGYDYSIQYRTGQSNAAEDALSWRTEAPFTQLFLLTVPNYLFLHIRDDFILQNDRIWLPKGLQVIPTILAEFHNTPTSGHMGIAKTLGRINENFAWPSMK